MTREWWIGKPLRGLKRPRFKIQDDDDDDDDDFAKPVGPAHTQGFCLPQILAKMLLKGKSSLFELVKLGQPWPEY